MGVNKHHANEPRRAYQPSGPWLNGIRPQSSVCADEPARKPQPSRKKQPPPPGNPDPGNYQLLRAEERHGYLLVMIKYPDCTNYEGHKILLFAEMTLLQLVNQKLIDPHFFPSGSQVASPVARFVPTEQGWDMALRFIEANPIIQNPGLP